MKHRIRTKGNAALWKYKGYEVEISIMYHDSKQGKDRLAYAMIHNGACIFCGTDFYCSPLHEWNSRQTFAALLDFLSLKDGDTDSEYFDSYTPEQIEWRDNHAEDLQIIKWEEFGDM